MDTNQMHPLQVIYESMREDPSYYNGDWVAKYLTFVKETVPDMMKKEVLSDKDVDLIVKKRENPIASYGPPGRHTKKVNNILTADKLHIFFINFNNMLQEVNILSNNEFIYSDKVYYRLYKNINNEINNIKEDSNFFLDYEGKPYSIINRMLSAVFPQYLGTLVNNITFQNTINRTNKFLKKSGTNDIINTGNSWLECNKHYFEYCNKHIKLIEDENKEYHISLLLDYLNRKNINTLMEIYKMKSENIILKETSDLLLQTKNLILTGAPGTGKTYLAKQIADELTDWDKNDEANKGKTNPCVTMVQFHPSYDYTDFVEGLRPIDNGNAEIGFERKDGTFKEFCREAYKNYVESKNITVKLEDYNKIEALLQEFRDYIIATIAKEEEFPIEAFRDTMSIVEIRKNRNNKWIYFVKTNRGGIHEQGMSKMVDNYINYKYYQFTNNSTLTMNEASVIFDSVLSTYAFGFLKAFDTFVIDNNKENIVKDIINNINYDKKVKLKNYVFIIDEINRGEISKIFGELFYAIDPGYRGEVGRINTQYQNLSDSEDDFSKGFYVPENVYIIGTMNDIDRSVDSFDFAMRRRFAWKEITPTDTQDSMLSTQEEAINRMNSLNKAISEMPELGAHYQLGASYFMKIKEYGYNYDKLWHYHIKGLLYEYLRGVPGADSKLADLKIAYDLKNEQ